MESEPESDYLPTEMSKLFFTLRGRRPIREIGEHYGIDKSVWSRVERGIGLPDVEAIIRIHHVSHIPYDALMESMEKDIQERRERKFISV